jgi:hypothetical protein
MARELGGSQISALLESVPGIVNVLRNPVADALVGMIRAGAGIEEFSHEYANELIQYAVRRGLIQASEGDRVLADVEAAVPKGKGRQVSGTKKKKPTAPARPKPKPPVKAKSAKPAPAKRGTARRPAKKATGKPKPATAKKSTGRPVKKSTKKTARR